MNTSAQITIEPYQNKSPDLHQSVFIAAGARLIGDVAVGADSSIWFNTVLRGDVNYIRIGSGTNIQDGTVVHVTKGGNPTIIGDQVTVGHSAVIHACTIGDLCLIGMGAIVLDGANIAPRSMIGAGSVIPPGKQYPPETLILGSPAKVVRNLSPDEIAFLEKSARQYIRLSKEYLTI